MRESRNGLKETNGTVALNPQKQEEPALTPSSRVRHVLGTTAWGILLALGLLAMLQITLIFNQQTSDFCQDYLGAQRILQGVSIYLPLHCFKGIIPIPVALEHDSHPPSAELLFLPFGFLSLARATLIWSFCCLAAYLATGFLLLKALGWRLLRGMALFVLLSLFWQPFLFAQSLLNFGQLLTLLLTAAWWLERKRRVRWAGGLLGLAALLKLWPAALILLAVLGRRWKFSRVALLTFAGGTLLAVGVLGLGAYNAYLGPVRVNEQYYVPNGGNVSLVAAVARPLVGYQAAAFPLPALAPEITLTEALLIGEVIAGMFFAGILLLITWVCWQRPGELVEQVSQSLLITTILLVFPLTWQWNIITLLLSGTILILVLRAAPRQPRWWFLLMGGGLLLFLEPGWILILPGWLIQQSAPGLAGLGILLFGLPTYGLLLFAGGQAWLLWRVGAAQVKRAHHVSAGPEQ